MRATTEPVVLTLPTSAERRALQAALAHALDPPRWHVSPAPGVGFPAAFAWWGPDALHAHPPDVMRRQHRALWRGTPSQDPVTGAVAALAQQGLPAVIAPCPPKALADLRPPGRRRPVWPCCPRVLIRPADEPHVPDRTSLGPLRRGASPPACVDGDPPAGSGGRPRDSLALAPAVGRPTHLVSSVSGPAGGRVAGLRPLGGGPPRARPHPHGAQRGAFTTRATPR